jgi:hypothetical protein
MTQTTQQLTILGYVYMIQHLSRSYMPGNHPRFLLLLQFNYEILYDRFFSCRTVVVERLYEQYKSIFGNVNYQWREEDPVPTGGLGG